jgi:hypothetical protein
MRSQIIPVAPPRAFLSERAAVRRFFESAQNHAEDPGSRPRDAGRLRFALSRLRRFIRVLRNAP